MSENRNDFLKKYNNYLAPEAVIWINGKKLSESWLYFTHLEVEKHLDGADTFSFTLSDAIDLEFEPKHATLFELGNKVEIHIGYADSNKQKSDLAMLFVGLITAVNWNFSEENYLDISVEGKDYSFLLMKYRYSKVIKEESISNIVEKIVKETYSSSIKELKIEATEVLYEKVENKELSDYLFIASLAKQIGYDFFIEGETLYFQTKVLQGTSQLSLYYGQEILGFKPELNVEKGISKVIVVGLTLDKDKKKIKGEASLPTNIPSNEEGIKKLLKSLDAIEYEVKEAVKTVEEANIRAKAILNDFRLKTFSAELKLIGIPELKPNITITLEGLGERFSREYYVTKAVHSFSDQGYETVVQLRWSE